MTTDESPTEILASDLQKLMVVVEAAVGLYNACEAMDDDGVDHGPGLSIGVFDAMTLLSDALEGLGLEES